MSESLQELLIEFRGPLKKGKKKKDFGSSRFLYLITEIK